MSMKNPLTPAGVDDVSNNNNNRMDLQEVGCRDVDWIELVRDRDRWRELVTAVMNHRVP